MKVDMSPQAVTQRLRTMDELWLLSAKLMNCKRVTESSDDSKRQRALEIQDSIRQILFNEWDPIGVNDNPKLADEYDSYIAPVYRLLSKDSSEEEIIDLLSRTENDKIDVPCASPEHLRPIAKKLLDLDIHFEQKPRK